MQYRESDILRACGPQATAAGRSYVDDDRVLDFMQLGDSIDAAVLGSRRQAYAQIIELRSGPAGITIDGDCSCPVGFNCKHVAAALLYGLAGQQAGAVAARTPDQRIDQMLAVPPRPAAPAAAVRDDLPAALAQWLDEVVGAHVEDPEAFPKAVTQRIVYLLVPQPDGLKTPRLGVRPVSVRMRKDGSFADNGKPYDINAIVYHNPAKFLRPSDLRILHGLARTGRSFTASGASTLSVDGGREALAEILGTGRARWLDLNGPALAPGPAVPGRLEWEAVEAATVPRLRVEGDVSVLNATPPVYVDAARGLIGPVETGLDAATIAALLRAPAVPAEAIAGLNAALASRAPRLAGLAPAVPATERLDGATPRPILRLVMAALPISQRVYGHYEAAYLPKDRVPLARLAFRYGPVVVPLSDTRPRVARLVEGRLLDVGRDPKAERDAALTLVEHGFVLAVERRANVPPEHDRDFLAQGDSSSWLPLLYEALPRLRDLGWEIEIAADFPIRMLHAAGPVEAELREGTGIGWLDLDLGIMVEGERIDLTEPIISMLSSPAFDARALKGQPAFIMLEDGRVLGIPADRLLPIVDAIRELAIGSDLGGGPIRLSQADAGLLGAFEEAVAGLDVVWHGGERIREMGRKLNATGGIPAVTLPPGFRAVLRPYQAEGLGWLAFLRDVGLGGILADDMGLGKTVQALGLLAIEQAEGRLDRPALVVAPTSLMANWRREAERFAPDLRVLTLQGLDRKSRFDRIAASDLVLTTYPLIARDHAVLAAQDWHVVILDEAQTIKNPDAATTKLLFGIKARHRFCLTGTPLENHLGELWSLFSFACPGLLGDRRGFTRIWRTPIEKHRRPRAQPSPGPPHQTLPAAPHQGRGGARPAAQDRNRRAHRTCRWSSATSTNRSASPCRPRVRAAIADKGLARSRIVILDALLKLRQVCCDPRLLKLKSKGPVPGSAKLDRLEEMLAELLAEGRRVIVFSQFTSMLDLIRPKLDAARTSYALLTGGTRDREAVIRSFEEGAAQVFLISLKAGGTGLNLVSADTIVLYDPWWNPAVEEQAIARAHRIGQDKPVFVHKLVATGTIEEKMETLKEKKSALALSLFDHDSAPTLAMTEADLDMLFEM